MREWEIRCLFGNEYMLDDALRELKKYSSIEAVKLDRRNLSIRLKKRSEELESELKRVVEAFHGFVESEAELGFYDELLEKRKAEKLKKKKH